MAHRIGNGICGAFPSGLESGAGQLNPKKPFYFTANLYTLG